MQGDVAHDWVQTTQDFHLGDDCSCPVCVKPKANIDLFQLTYISFKHKSWSCLFLNLAK